MQTETEGSEDQAMPERTARLVQWIWPVLGSISIGAIVVMILQSPQLSSKLGIQPVLVQKEQIAVNLPLKTNAGPPSAAAKRQAVKSSPVPVMAGKDRAKADNQEVGKLTTRLREQAERIKKLESMVSGAGSVTGSVGPLRQSGKAARAGAKAPMSSVSKLSRSITTANVDHTFKTDSLNIKMPVISVMPEKVEIPDLRPATGSDGGDTKSAARTEKPARKDSKAPAPASKTVAKSTGAAKAAKPNKPVKIALLSKAEDELSEDEPGGQYGIRLATADKISKLKTIWKKLGRNSKGKELKALKSRVQSRKDKSGKKIYALVAGPLPDMGEAIELCVRLKLKGIACAQTDFTGDPL